MVLIDFIISHTKIANCTTLSPTKSVQEKERVQSTATTPQQHQLATHQSCRFSSDRGVVVFLAVYSGQTFMKVVNHNSMTEEGFNSNDVRKMF